MTAALPDADGNVTEGPGFSVLARVDGRLVGSGSPGLSTMQLRDAYWAAHNDPKDAGPLSYAR